jgi:hypothetical protein
MSVARAVVFAKLPIVGQVKMRLADGVGAEKAAELYRLWVPPFIEMLCGIGPLLSTEVCLAVDSSQDRSEALQQARTWLPFAIDFGFQSGEGLGEKLKDSFDRQFEAGWEAVIALGSDSPQLTPSDILANLSLLRDNKMVVGPAEDGGYYAIGLRQRPGNLFDPVRWSCAHTLEDTRKGGEKNGWQVSLGPSSYDIDTMAGLERLLREDVHGKWGALREVLERGG